MAQKKRTPKTSKGIHGGGGKTRLGTLEKALISSNYIERLGARRAARLNRAAK